MKSIERNPKVGILEWFRPGEYERVKEVLNSLKEIDVKHFRTGFSWADWHTPQGEKWYDWLIPKISSGFEILPVFTYTPPSLGIEYKTSSPPKNPKDYADFLDFIIKRYDKHFKWIELWNEPNNINDWDWRIDPEWNIFSEMIVDAAYWTKQLNKKTVLGGMAPTDPNWLRLMAERNVLENIDAVSIHGFPGTWEFDWEDWSVNVNKVKKILNDFNLEKEIWITEAGYSTWLHDEHKQMQEFVKLIEAPVDRIYWYSAQDLHPELSHQDGFHEDERHYHFGLKKADGNPKLLYRIWEKSGIEGVKNMAHFEKRLMKKNKEKGNHNKISTNGDRPILIVGGAGFIGTNLSDRFLSNGTKVKVLDNLSRPGVEQNLEWLVNKHGHLIDVEIGDVRNKYLIADAVKNVKAVYNFAAQVAVTTSLVDPRTDFDINVQGIINILEAIRTSGNKIPLIFTSTNKVYGGLNDITLTENLSRYYPTEKELFFNGISENRNLDFHSPYGCSKGAADQYVLDYCRSFDIPTAVFRMSCIYGPHQFGTEDQGWVAHFLIRALEGKDITIFGDGKQVRDILFVQDLVDAFILAKDNIDKIKGTAFNIGGGVANTVSLIEILDLIKNQIDTNFNVKFDKWRIGDQKYYVSDTRKFKNATGWNPKVKVEEGVNLLSNWLIKNRSFDSEKILVE